MIVKPIKNILCVPDRDQNSFIPHMSSSFLCKLDIVRHYSRQDLIITLILCISTIVKIKIIFFWNSNAGFVSTVKLCDSPANTILNMQIYDS